MSFYPNNTQLEFSGFISTVENLAPPRDDGSTPISPLQITLIDKSVYKDWILKKHYARRVPPIQFAYGLFSNGECIGCVTYGPSASPQIANSLCPNDKSRVLELNRLVIDTSIKNAASFLVGRSLRMLPNGKIVCSYADGKMGHVGYVYQA